MQETLMTVIPVMFHPYEDEVITSWVYRLARANGMSIREFCHAYQTGWFDEHYRTYRFKDCRIEGLFFAGKNIRGFPDPAGLFLRHTVFPASCRLHPPAGVFLFTQNCDAVRSLSYLLQTYLYNRGEQPYDLPSEYLKQYNRICPQCIMEDAESGRQGYLRVWHQLPGVRACAVHKCPLVEIDNELNNSNPWKECDMDGGLDAACAYAMEAYGSYWKKPEFRPVSAPVINGIRPLETDGIFLFAQCGTCGERFLTTVYACAKGRGCPVCDRQKDMVKESMKMLPGYRVSRDGDDPGDWKVTHCCGKMLPYTWSDVAWGGKRCMCGMGAL